MQEHPFTLPRGYLAPDGTVHRDGAMRLALAGDEIIPLEDSRVKGNRAYLVILLLARVITRLGTLSGDEITPAVIEGLYSADLAYLERFFREVNGFASDREEREVVCPHCGREFRLGENPW